MDRELLSQYSDGLIATTGCPSGEVQTRLRLGQYDEALKAASDYRDIFDSRATFVNAELAKVYGISGITGSSPVPRESPSRKARAISSPRPREAT